MLNASTPPVAIVGAGPVGLALALRLAKSGVKTVLMDAKPHQIKQGSKACLIQGDVLEVLDKVGCGEQIGREGIAWHVGHTYIRNQEISRTEYAKRPGYGEFVNISQHRIEQIMLKALEDEPLCEVLWDHRIIDIEATETGATLVVETGGKLQDMSFRYVVGCDGIRSKVRELMDIEWTGYTHKDRFLITDIYTKLPISKERHFHFDPSFNPGRQLVMHPQPNEMWRIDWQLPPSADIEAEKENGELDKRIRKVIGDVDYTIDWLSTYRFNQRVAERFRVGSVMLAGDAAHALPPYGSRGMNSGIQDADNLAWKLVAVLQERADETLLDSYHEERYRAACENLRVTEATIRFMVPPTFLHRLWRDMLLRLSEKVPSARKMLNSGRMAEPFRYTESPLIEEGAENPLVGAFAPDLKVNGAGTAKRLRHCFGPDFTAMAFCSNAMAVKCLATRWEALRKSHGVKILALLPEGSSTSGVPQGVDVAFYAPEDAKTYTEADAEWALIRPDGHIAICGPMVANRPLNSFLHASGYYEDAPKVSTQSETYIPTPLAATAAE